ncbi:hypothetical protein W97_02936 [Coniosporium apollinis CBS 100218]|uniref:Uncharacterized protein n=1 Tax=Coniosporium apollinis (strain CBS 100218) TaxID=1168221 RepID=R7YPD9_CONA1|nr:uncharacterized protein W97_02936 [Coniosporium apollinis CBS 100218]EON63708.1 hypothetical protein W97_02936 [Coniosporium apollinis CBS 100218]
MNNFLPFNTDNLPNRYIGIQIHRYNNILVDRITALEAECAMLRQRLRDSQDQGAELRVWIAQLLELPVIEVIEQSEESGTESDVEVDEGSNDSFTTAESEG